MDYNLAKISMMPIFPPRIPNDIKEELAKFNYNAEAWYSGQFLSYIMKPNYELNEALNTKRIKLHIYKPFIG